MTRPTLQLGSYGASVAVLQRALGLPADASFGPVTHAAVVAHQRLHGLGADGIVGPATWATLAIPQPLPAPTGADLDLGPPIADFVGFPRPGVVQVSCGYHHTGGWRPSIHRGWDLAIPSGAARVVALADGWVALADEVDAVARAAGDPRHFNGGAGRYAILVYPLPDGRHLVQRVLHLADIEDRWSGGGESTAAQSCRAGDVIGVVGGDAAADVGAGFAFGSGHLHTDLKLVESYDPAQPFGYLWAAWGAAAFLNPADFLTPALSQRWTLEHAAGWDR